MIKHIIILKMDTIQGIGGTTESYLSNVDVFETKCYHQNAIQKHFRFSIHLAFNLHSTILTLCLQFPSLTVHYY